MDGSNGSDNADPIPEDTDVVVVGGGPAGSTIASFLARKGWSVTVFERAVFPREHVGESMLPFCYGIFEELGVLETMKQRFVRKPGVRFLDTDGHTATTWCFGHKIDGPSHLSFQVVRAEFDQILLDHSAEEGAQVFEGVTVRGVDLGGPDGAGGGAVVDVVDATGQPRRVRCRFVVDASGRDTFLANRMRTKTAHKELERTALSAPWTGCDFTGGLQEGMIQIVYTGGEKQGWIWVIPLSRDRLSVGVVMNSAYYRERRRSMLDGGSDRWQQDLYLDEIMASPFVAEVLAPAKQLYDVMVNGDYSYVCHDKWGDDYALVGDASAFIDPIFSSGVYLAMQSSRYLADAVDLRLREGVAASAGAMKEVYDRITGAYALVDKLIRLFYTPEVLNFAQLGSAAAAFDDADHYAKAMGLQHFLLAGDFFEQSHRYSEFIDTLRDPRKFRMYENYVMNRDEFQADASCDKAPDEIFPPDVDAHEARRQALGI